MFPRIVYESFRHQARRKLLAGIAITLGVAVATAMIAVATDIGDKINRELRSRRRQPETAERRHIPERSRFA
jgi:putative ABC transport system permease protein